MSRLEFKANGDYRQYLDLLVQLHLAISPDHGDDARANRIRDEMDAPWRGLSSAEIDRLKGLSADLHSLEIRIDRPQDALTVEGRAICNEFQSAFELKQWDKALGALRKASRFFELSHVSLARGKIWNALGDPEISLLFYQHAADLVLETVQSKP